MRKGAEKGEKARFYLGGRDVWPDRYDQDRKKEKGKARAPGRSGEYSERKEEVREQFLVKGLSVHSAEKEKEGRVPQIYPRIFRKKGEGGVY